MLLTWLGSYRNNTLWYIQVKGIVQHFWQIGLLPLYSFKATWVCTSAPDFSDNTVTSLDGGVFQELHSRGTCWAEWFHNNTFAEQNPVCSFWIWWVLREACAVKQLLLCHLDLKTTGTVTSKPAHMAATGILAQDQLAKMLNYHFQRLQKQRENCQTQVWGCVGGNVYKLGSWRRPGSGPGTGPGPRQHGEELMSLLPPASVYKRPQTAAAPTLSSPCLMHRSLLSAAVWAPAGPTCAWLALLWSGWSWAWVCLYGRRAPWPLQSASQRARCQQASRPRLRSSRVLAPVTCHCCSGLERN